jgi:hypothetical protein
MIPVATMTKSMSRWTVSFDDVVRRTPERVDLVVEGVSNLSDDGNDGNAEG